jgi:hypothetical protein
MKLIYKHHFKKAERIMLVQMGCEKSKVFDGQVGGNLNDEKKHDNHIEIQSIEPKKQEKAKEEKERKENEILEERKPIALVEEIEKTQRMDFDNTINGCLFFNFLCLIFRYSEKKIR